MEQYKIDRINELAREAKVRELTPEEQAERKVLRDEYIAGYRKNLEAQLGSITIVDDNGMHSKLHKKDQ